MTARSIAAAVLIVVLSVVPSSAILTDILKTCRNVSCEVDSEYSEYPTLNPRENYKWIAAGLPLIFWDAVADGHLFTHSNISVTCRQQLEKVSSAMRNDSEWGYRFLDSSGKSPPGLFRSTPTALGEFDECLAIDAEGIKGQYCMIDMHHLRKKTTAGQMDFQRIKVVPDYPFFSALCLPSTCSAAEVQSSLRQLLKHHLIKVAGHISCDTRESIGWEFQLEKMTKKQIFSALFLIVVSSMTAAGTAIDIVKTQSPVATAKLPSDFLISMSVKRVAQKLFYAKSYKYEILVFDSLKLFILIAAVMAHIVLCAESPISYATFAKLDYLDDLWRSWYTQLASNDTYLTVIPLITGMASFMILYPMTKKQKSIPYFGAVIDRVSRFLPQIMVLTACEMLWPLSGSGPFFTRMANLVHQRCDNNWYLNLFFLNNFFIEGVDACATHTFWLSVDVQLFIAGVFAIFLFGKNDAIGVFFCAAMFFLGTFWTAVTAYVRQSAISFYYVNPDPVKINEYYTDIYEKPLAYFPAFFAGMLIAFFRSKGYLRHTFHGYWTNVMVFAVVCGINYLPNMNYGLYNVLGFYTPADSWIVIPSSRLLQLLAYVCMYLFWMSLEPQWNAYYESLESEEDANKLKFHPFKSLVRLTLPLYICNYLYIRYEFFTRRFLHPNGSLWMFKRTISSLLIVLLFTLAFQLLLLGPVGGLREYLMGRSRGHDPRPEAAVRAEAHALHVREEISAARQDKSEEEK